MQTEVQRTHNIAARVREHERRLIEAAAERARVNLTEFVRDAALLRARHILKQQPEGER